MSETAPRQLRAEHVWLGLVVTIQAAICWHFASRSYFAVDDFLLFQAAHRGGFSLDFLFADAREHLAPGVQLVNLLVQRHVPFEWDVTLTFLLAVHSIGVVLVQRILRLLCGPAWWTYVLAFAYGISILFTSSFQYWAAGELRFPSTALSLAAIHGYLCWRRTGRRVWLAWSVAAVWGALVFYEKALLVPVYLVLMRLLLLDQESRLQDSARAVIREWRIWALYAVPVLAYGAVYLAGAYGEAGPGPRVPRHEVLAYVRVAWLDGFVPSLFGVRVEPDSGALVHTWAVVACQLALLAAAAVSVSRRLSAWRPWLFLGIAFMLNTLIVYPRLSQFQPLGGGHLVGYVQRYFTELAYLVPLVIGAAFARPGGGRRAKLVPSRPAPAVATAAALVLAAYTGLSWASDRTIVREAPNTEFSRQWVANVRGDVEARRRSGVEPVLLDAFIPGEILPAFIEPGASLLSRTVPLFLDGVRFNQVSDRTFRVQPDGHLRPVVFRPAYARAGIPCLTAPHGRRTVVVQPPRPLRRRAPELGRSWYVRTTYRTDSPTGLPIAADLGLGYPPRPSDALPPRPADGEALTELGALPPPGPATLVGLRVDIPAGRSACLRRLVVGSFAP